MHKSYGETPQSMFTSVQLDPSVASEGLGLLEGGSRRLLESHICTEYILGLDTVDSETPMLDASHPRAQYMHLRIVAICFCDSM